VGSLDFGFMVGTSWVWFGTGSSFVPYVASTFISNRWVSYSHTIASILSQGGVEYSFLRCRASVHLGSCWTTLDTEESLFGSIRRPSWGVLVVSFHILFYLQRLASFSSTVGLWFILTIFLHFGNNCLL
jgi:hypothetical protein